METIKEVVGSVALLALATLLTAAYLIVTPDQATAECDACRAALSALN